MPWIYVIPAPLLGVLIVGAFVLASATGLWLTRKWVRPPSLSHNDLAGFLYAVIGVIYAVLLGMTAVAAWDDFQSIKQTTVLEANALENLVHGLEGYPEPARSQLQAKTRQYLRSVIHDEWDAMHHAQASPQTQRAADDLVRDWVKFQPRTQGEGILFERSLTQIHLFLDQRQLRLDAAQSGLDHVMWGVLLFGACLTIGFTFFFWAENLWLHTLMTCSLAALIGIIVYWIVIYDHPLWGSIRIAPTAFERVLTTFEAQGTPGPR
jgi:hypothetical protein